MIRLLSWILVFCLLLSPASGEQGDWTRFRGPNGTGISDAAGVPVAWTDRDYNWKVELPGAGHSSPVVWNNRIYLTSGSSETAQRTIFCLDTAHGKIVWRRDYPSHTFRQHRDNSYATATPAVDAEGVVVNWSTPDNIILLAFDHEGQQIWQRNLGPFVGKHGTGASPINFKDSVVFSNDQEDPGKLPDVYGELGARIPAGKSFLIALDRQTGETRWKLDRRTHLSAYSTPCVRHPDDGPSELIFTSTGHGISGVDPTTGEVNWEIDDLFLDRCVGSPLALPGLVIAGYGRGIRGSRYVAVRPGSIPKGVEPRLVYDVTQSVPLVPTPLLKDGRLFLWADDGVVTCLNVRTGELTWRERIGGSFYGSPVCVNNRLYCVAKNGEVVVLAASDKCEVLARIPLGEPSYATPAVSEGVMYLRTRSHLFSLGSTEE